MSQPPNPYDVIIIGAGAAGLMCAFTAGQRGRRVLLLDHAAEAGAKILISGGGRCNFTNIGTNPTCFWSENPQFCRTALRRYTAPDFIAMVDHHAIAYHEKTLGQLFCDGSARAILNMLLAECQTAGVTIRLNCRIADVAHTAAAQPAKFSVRTSQGTFAAESLVLATGGLSIPKLGATSFAYDIARQFGLRVITPRPGLVPLTFAEDLLALMRPLSGVSLDSDAAIGRNHFRERTLFTHRGLSGPAILQISSAWQSGPITLNLLPGQDATAFLLARKRERPKAELRTILSEILPQRLAQALAPPTPDAETREPNIADLPDKTLRDLATRLTAWQITPNGTEGFAKAEVTAGGIDTRDLSPNTLQANAIPGLFAIGEAVDVTGWLGGYNFQWAWSSAHCAGRAA